MNSEMSMYEFMRATAEKRPDSWAYRFMGRGARMREMLDEIDLAAEGLNRFGVNPGDTVSLCLPNIPHAIIAFYAVNKLGAIANMIHPLTPTKQLIGYLKKTDSKFLFLPDIFYKQHAAELEREGIKVVLCSACDYLPLLTGSLFIIKNYEKLKGIKTNQRVIRWKALFKRSKTKSVFSPPAPGACAVYLHSGGTTGSPKTIMLSSKAFNEIALNGLYMSGLKSVTDEKMIAVLPLFHGFGLGVCVHTMLSNGGSCVLIPKFSPKTVTNIIKREKAQLIATVPTMLEALLSYDEFMSTDLSCIKSVFCGGDKLPMDLKKRFDDCLKSNNSNAQVMEGYGLTETVTVCCVNTPDNNRPGSVGKPIQKIHLKIIDTETGEELPANRDGEICVTGPTMMLGYLNDKEATEFAVRRHADGKLWVHTGDYGYVDEDGFVWFKQRLKRIIKCSGVAVFPSEVEECISSAEEVSACCVIGVPHPVKMETVKAFVVLEKGVQPSDSLRDKIKKLCSDRLIKWAVPSEIEFVTELPLTLVGKVDFHELAKREREKQTANI
ncbi:MAG TPA: class I adenylate-forming enzyme family protein [Clostridia bacterium]|nr:class I adenylate-forming enzyme family protein [Clostridia bacterium]